MWQSRPLRQTIVHIHHTQKRWHGDGGVLDLQELRKGWSPGESRQRQRGPAPLLNGKRQRPLNTIPRGRAEHRIQFSREFYFHPCALNPRACRLIDHGLSGLPTSPTRGR